MINKKIIKFVSVVLISIIICLNFSVVAFASDTYYCWNCASCNSRSYCYNCPYCGWDICPYCGACINSGDCTGFYERRSGYPYYSTTHTYTTKYNYENDYSSYDDTELDSGSGGTAIAIGVFAFLFSLPLLIKIYYWIADIKYRKRKAKENDENTDILESTINEEATINEESTITDDLLQDSLVTEKEDNKKYGGLVFIIVTMVVILIVAIANSSSNDGLNSDDNDVTDSVTTSYNEGTDSNKESTGSNKKSNKNGYADNQSLSDAQSVITTNASDPPVNITTDSNKENDVGVTSTIQTTESKDNNSKTTTTTTDPWAVTTTSYPMVNNNVIVSDTLLKVGTDYIVFTNPSTNNAYKKLVLYYENNIIWTSNLLAPGESDSFLARGVFPDKPVMTFYYQYSYDPHKGFEQEIKKSYCPLSIYVSTLSE